MVEEKSAGGTKGPQRRMRSQPAERTSKLT
jgi:hypothetical protein